ncbi:hypothetical protein RKD26_001106 [Streptomyces calvus]|uniref:hypothetical protein n=1 Tax=Streptomyces calvus TaxID=67282 RepID=UPI0035140E1D
MTPSREAKDYATTDSDLITRRVLAGPTMRRAGSSRFVDRPVDDPAGAAPAPGWPGNGPAGSRRTGWTEGLARTVGWFSRAEAA